MNLYHTDRLALVAQMDFLIDHSGSLTSSAFTYLMNEHARFTHIFFQKVLHIVLHSRGPWKFSLADIKKNILQE